MIHPDFIVFLPTLGWFSKYKLDRSFSQSSTVDMHIEDVFTSIYICMLTLKANTIDFCIWVFPKIRGTPKWMVYNGKPY